MTCRFCGGAGFISVSKDPDEIADCVCTDPVETTPTGIPIEDCKTCGRRHPATREHCVECGAASLFPHAAHSTKESE